MSDTQTHCFKCSIHLRGGGVWCYSCDTYMNIICSGLSTKTDHHPNFICKLCSEFQTISKNKVSFKIADAMNIILTKTPKDGPQTECAMICKMIMPHLLLAMSKNLK